MAPGGMVEVYRDSHTVVYGAASTVSTSGPSSIYKETGSTYSNDFYPYGIYADSNSPLNDTPDYHETRRRYQTYLVKFVTGNFGCPWTSWVKGKWAFRQLATVRVAPDCKLRRKEALRTTRAHRRAIRALMRPV